MGTRGCHWLLLAAGLLVFGGCGGSGGKAGNNGGGQTRVTVSGTARYEFVPHRAGCNGLDFANTASRPVRGATVQLLDDTTDAVIASTVSTATGGYVFTNVPANTMVRIRVRAELKQAGVPGWDVEVRDNYLAGASDSDVPAPPELASRALYVTDSGSFNTGSANLTRDTTATSGWDGSAYTGDRAAAPFALLDVVYQAIQFIRATDPTANFPPLDMYWSTNNRTSDTIDLTAGDIGTSSYYADLDSLFILGDATDDTDEFDDHVIAHEWGHYFEDVLSRSDSTGGAHNLGEALVATLAFSEGWASALGAMILGDPLYCDTSVPGTTGGYGFNAETSDFGTSGWFNELDTMGIIYDLWDTADDRADTGSIGFGPIYNVMTGPEVFTQAFTSMFSFARELRAMLGTQDAALLDALLNQQNIVSGNNLDIWASNETNNAGVPASVAPTVLPLYLDYTAGDPPMQVCVNSYLDGLARDGNNPGEDRYLRITVPFDDQYDVSVVTTTPTPATPDPNDRDQSDPDIYIVRGSGPELVAQGTTGTANVEPTFRTPVLSAGETYVAMLEEWRFDDSEASTSFPQQICFDVSLASTP